MRKRVLFTIQGEGRGHMTQSIALKNILEKSNYEIVGAIVGTSSRREIPDFIRKGLAVELHEIQSPNFITDKNNKGLDIGNSITKNLFQLPKFAGNLKEIDRMVKKLRPELIINFYEPLIGLYNKFYRGNYKTICIAHQYLTLHPEFNLPKGYALEKKALQFFSKLTSYNCHARLGLSFYEFSDFRKNKVFVVPPLLRPEIKNLSIKEGDFLLIYILNKGYKADILNWHNKNKTVPIHCFSDDPEVEDEHKVDDTLTFHQLNGSKFLEKMAACKALVSTSGFESVCEAMYLNKPVLMVPVEGHYEQFVNSRDAHSAGAGVYSNQFDIDKLIAYLEEGKRSMTVFKNWADEAELKITRIINRIAND